MRAKLLAWAKERGIQFQHASMLYMQEGILSRLVASPYADKLILKGGFLIFTYAGSAGRMTKDIDFLGQSISNDEKALAEIIMRIVGIHQDDGLVFDAESVVTERISEGADYQGVRVRVGCSLDSLRNRLQIDIGFGDAVIPGPSLLPITGMLGRPIIEVAAYPLAAVVAEKVEIMIALGSINSRMKDFFDVAYLLDHHDIPDAYLYESLSATFARRRTELPEFPAMFSASFAASATVLSHWRGFLMRSQLGEIAFDSVLAIIKRRIEPLYLKIRARS